MSEDSDNSVENEKENKVREQTKVLRERLRT
jgi:hypothetical protein